MVKTEQLYIYGDMMSQPTRAVVWLCNLAEIPYTFKTIRLAQQEHKTAEYRHINPFSLVPAIQKGNMKLFESHAILQYLSDSYRIPEHYYPRSSLEDRAAINEYLHWHHLGVRQPCVRLLLHQWLAPMGGAPKPSEETLERDRKYIRVALQRLDQHFLNHGDHPFITGRREISIADLSAYCELKQLEIVQFEDIVQKDLRRKRYPNLHRWIEAMERMPYCDTVHQIFGIVLNKTLSRL
eukprot:gb/GECH01014420.1/.p1 GENE.gb/GECH01014420.1/~~gb/GECH01014420.1/.p1  ORF type:complete len:238 (+),score=52.45 gb/GECH01014420.1/:1-714(+)